MNRQVTRTNTPPNPKLRELILYICERCANDPAFGMTRLNKDLFFTDAAAFKELGRSVTGASYQKLEHGPAPRAMMPTLKELEASGALQMQSGAFFGHLQKRPVATRSAACDLFTPEELALVDRVLSEHTGVTGSAVSDKSHDLIAWRVAEIGETIPLSATIFDDDLLTDAEVAHGQQLNDRIEEFLTANGDA
jgi:hypothetical protein